MKTAAMAHQLEALRRMQGKEYFGLFMEQGTGKTWTLLADMERLYSSGKIDAALVIAPKGVHTNWVTREIPTHMDAPVIARRWRSGGGKKWMKHVEELFRPREDGEQVPLRVLSMNIDALITKDGFAFAKKFLSLTKAMFIIDESSRIKSVSAGRTQAAERLKPLSLYRRIASGTPITQSPIDAFAQMEFLESGLLGTTSYRAFVAEYAELMDRNHPMMLELARRNPRVASAQVVAKNRDGTPKWKNLDKLQRLLEPHTYRVLKKDCLDLPDKIYTQHFFDMTAEQQRAYALMQDELRLELENGDKLTVKELASLMKLQQITSGFVMRPDSADPVLIGEKNPRLSALMEIVEDISGQFIVWARFHEELRAVAHALREAGLRVVEYHGRIGTNEREEAVDAFQSGNADVFVGQPQSGGIGLTLTNAGDVIYYSNDFNLETRLQSEDRAHRIGTKKNVRYVDLIAAGTIDESVVRALQRKQNVASVVLGDLQRSQTSDNY